MVIYVFFIAVEKNHFSSLPNQPQLLMKELKIKELKRIAEKAVGLESPNSSNTEKGKLGKVGREREREQTKIRQQG